MVDRAHGPWIIVGRPLGVFFGQRFLYFDIARRPTVNDAARVPVDGLGTAFFLCRMQVLQGVGMFGRQISPIATEPTGLGF